ncbi:hypothetical protein BC936DRAFT_136646 [Jimgerdemannia flammicorona]|uniref:BZIP domain-containing protein n=1 Tax=Jimgerdemannia flammicorona TaxID=994334 RepID=A0A433DJP1_9FUNG|nr:hypothetical protein BC936DRAFT_136646 [Jimgerdemannia flammicorona]
MSFAETTSSRTLPPLSSALGQTVAVSHGVSLQQALTLPPVSFLSNYGSPPQLHSVPPTQPPTSTTAYVVTALPQYQPAAQQQLSPSSTITTTVTTAHHIPSSTRAMPILPKLGREYTSPPPSLLPSPSSTRDYPDLRTSPTLTSASAVLAGSPPSHSYYPRPTSSTSSEHHHHHHHHHHSSQGHSDHYGSPPSHHSQRSGSIQPSPDEILAEKRRRNAGASARFRDRRKQRERENQDRCEYLERRVAELEKALAHATDGVLPEKEHKRRGREGKDGKSSSSGGGEHRKESLAGRVSDLETQVVRTRIEREGAYRKISELEKEVSWNDML